MVEVLNIEGFIAPPGSYKYVKVPVAKSLDDLCNHYTLSEIYVDSGYSTPIVDTSWVKNTKDLKISKMEPTSIKGLNKKAMNQ